MCGQHSAQGQRQELTVHPSLHLCLPESILLGTKLEELKGLSWLLYFELWLGPEKWLQWAQSACVLSVVLPWRDLVLVCTQVEIISLPFKTVFMIKSGVAYKGSGLLHSMLSL